MPYARSQLIESLRHLGLNSETIVMVHASVRSVGEIYGGPDEIHRAVEEAVQPGGTVMMYVGCPDGFDDVGRGVYAATEEAEIVAHQPAFDPQTARASRNFGALAEFFRSFSGTISSASASGRIAARGARAAWLIADQPWNYAYGRGSPFEKLCEAGGRLLLLGSDHDEVTLLHYAEHVAEFEGKRIARYHVPVMRDGKRTWVPCEEFDTSGRGVHPNWPDRFFARIVDDFIARYAATAFCSRGMVGNAESVLMDAAALVTHACPLMVGQAHGGIDPFVGPAPS
jgi:aminoglycoside 3-N-acetyltransferase